MPFMEAEQEVQKLLNNSYRYLGYRARTKKEMIDYLSKKIQKNTSSSDIINVVIKRLENQGLINDLAFIEAFVSSRNNAKPKSIYALRVELLQKGVSSELIDTYFNTNAPSEYQLAKKAVNKKWKLFKRFSPEIRFKKVASFLGNRGFSYEIIKKTFEELQSEE